MARIAFILLCHKDPAGIIAQAERLTAAGDAASLAVVRMERHAPGAPSLPGRYVGCSPRGVSPRPERSSTTSYSRDLWMVPRWPRYERRTN